MFFKLIQDLQLCNQNMLLTYVLYFLYEVYQKDLTFKLHQWWYLSRAYRAVVSFDEIHQSQWGIKKSELYTETFFVLEVPMTSLAEASLRCLLLLGYKTVFFKVFSSVIIFSVATVSYAPSDWSLREKWHWWEQEYSQNWPVFSWEACKAQRKTAVCLRAFFLWGLWVVSVLSFIGFL